MFSRILVPLDGSRLAEAALSPARSLALRFGSELVLLHVLEKGAPARVHGEPHLMEEGEAGQYLAGLAARLERDGVRVGWHVHEVPVGDVAGGIATHTSELGADLVCLATHGRGGLKRILVGTIAQQVIATGSGPVLVVHPGRGRPEFSPRSILVPLDGSPTHEASLPFARGLASAYGALVHLVRVVPRAGQVGGEARAARRLLPLTTEVLLEVEVEAAREYLAGIAARLRAEGVEADFHVLRGDPPAELVGALERTSADLAVVATHALLAWGAFWEASVTPKLVGGWKGPCLLVRAPRLG